MGVVGVAAGTSMLVMWLVTGWTVAEFGWRAAFRYPPLLMVPAAIALFFFVRDRPSDIGLEDLDEAGMLDKSSSPPDRDVSHESARLLDDEHTIDSSPFLREGVRGWVDQGPSNSVAPARKNMPARPRQKNLTPGYRHKNLKATPLFRNGLVPMTKCR